MGSHTFDPVFVESLHLGKGVCELTRRLVEAISLEKGRPVRAKDVARKLAISMDQAYSKLRYAEKVGAIGRANKPEKSNRKAYLPNPRPRFVPDPNKLFRELQDLGRTVRFLHPITGKEIVYRREHA